MTTNAIATGPPAKPATVDLPAPLGPMMATRLLISCKELTPNTTPEELELSRRAGFLMLYIIHIYIIIYICLSILGGRRVTGCAN
jgi:hypothetical protein